MKIKHLVEYLMILRKYVIYHQFSQMRDFLTKIIYEVECGDILDFRDYRILLGITELDVRCMDIEDSYQMLRRINERFIRELNRQPFDINI